VLAALRGAPELRGLVRFNEFSLSVEYTRAPPWRQCSPGDIWQESDDTALQVWLQDQDINVRGRAVVADTVVLAGKDTAFHPVREYLQSTEWDGAPRLRSWLREYLGAVGDPDYLAAVGLRFMVSAVARIFRPGCQADHVLVLEGAQGIGKTTTARTLAVQPTWFAGSLPDIHSKDAPLQLLGHWIVEIAELKGMRNSQLEATKSFITQAADTFRPPYGRRTGQFPRQCVFIATTNEGEYLRDRTGNRRYWPVRCTRIIRDALVRDCGQLWAEAVREYCAGTAWHLTDLESLLAGTEQDERLLKTELEADVSEYLELQLGLGTREVTVRDVLVHGLGLDPDASNYIELARRHGGAVADAMESCSWRKVGRRGSGRNKRTVYSFDGQGGQPKR
jgi:putative DNA primase/helicase